MLRDRRVGRGHLPGRWVHDGGHPVEPPVPGQPAQPERDLVLSVGQLGLFHRFAQHPTPLRRVRQRPHQQVCPFAVPVPTGRWIRQLDPIPLGFLTGRMINDRDRATLRRMARLAHRPHTPQPQRPGERGIRPVIAEVGDLVEQGRRPQMRVLNQPGRAARGVPCERVVTGRCPDPDLPFPVEIHLDRLAVPADMPGDRRDRPTPPAQRVDVHVVLLCEHEAGPLRVAGGGQRPSASRGPRHGCGSHTGGEFQ